MLTVAGVLGFVLTAPLRCLVPACPPCPLTPDESFSAQVFDHTSIRRDPSEWHCWVKGCELFTSSWRSCEILPSPFGQERRRNLSAALSPQGPVWVWCLCRGAGVGLQGRCGGGRAPLLLGGGLESSFARWSGPQGAGPGVVTLRRCGQAQGCW